MPKHQRDIDQRPFRSKAEQAREESLQSQYRSLAIPEVVAALQQKSDETDGPLAKS